MSEAEKDFQEVIREAGPMVDDDLAARLRDCAVEYELDYEELYDWATDITISAALLENVKDGFLDVVSFNGEPAFRMSTAGSTQAESILNRSTAGRRLVKAAKKKRQEDDEVLSNPPTDL